MYSYPHSCFAFVLLCINNNLMGLNQTVPIVECSARNNDLYNTHLFGKHFWFKKKKIFCLVSLLYGHPGNRTTAPLLTFVLFYLFFWVGGRGGFYYDAVISYIQYHWMTGWKLIWKIFGGSCRGVAFSCSDWANPRNVLANVSGSTAGIRTQHLLNTDVLRNRYSSLLVRTYVAT